MKSQVYCLTKRLDIATNLQEVFYSSMNNSVYGSGVESTFAKSIGNGATFNASCILRAYDTLTNAKMKY